MGEFVAKWICYFYTMKKKPNYKEMTLEELRELLFERDRQIGGLEIEHEENQKTIAGLSARKAYLDGIKEENDRFFRRKNLL